MDIEKLSQKIRELRNVKCFSQEELAIRSGVSLRTVQRVEKAETTPSGETLKRILKTLGTSYEELLSQSITVEHPLRTLKGTNEYLHIFEDKLIINRSVTSEEELMQTYQKSISYLFKSLGVLIVLTLLFTILAVVFLFSENIDLFVMTTSFAVMFLGIIFLSMTFSSGNPYIDRNHIVKTKIENMKMGYICFVIIYREGKRIKERGVTFNTRDLTYVQEGLFLENLITTYEVEQNNDALVPIFFIPVMYVLVGIFNGFELMVISICGFIGTFWIIAKMIIKYVKNNREFA